MALGGRNSGNPTLSAEDKARVRKAVDEINKAMTRIKSERELITETIKEVASETSLNKKMIRRLAKTYFNQSFDLDYTETRDFEDLYETVVKKS